MHAAFRRSDIGASDVAVSAIAAAGGTPGTAGEATAPINQARWRNRIRATGTVRALQVQVTETGSSLGCEIGDEAGSLLLVASHELDPISTSNGWYDVTVTVSSDSSWSQRFTGHLENGSASVTG